MKKMKKILIFGFTMVSAFLMLSMISVARPVIENENMKIIKQTSVEKTFNKISQDKILSYYVTKLYNKASVKNLINKIMSSDSDNERQILITNLGNTLKSSSEYRSVNLRISSMYSSDLEQIAESYYTSEEPTWFPGLWLFVILALLYDALATATGWLLLVGIPLAIIFVCALIAGVILGPIVLVIAFILWILSLISGNGNSISMELENSNPCVSSPQIS